MNARREGLASLLKPRSVVLIGASEDPFTYSGAPLANLLASGYGGGLHVVNPKRDAVQGVPAYKSVLDVPGAVDTAVITVPTGAVLSVLDECVRKGVRSATIVSSGFERSSADAAEVGRFEELRRLTAASGIRILGPNTAGLVNLFDAYVPRAANNGLAFDRLRPGGVVLITQSGALGNTVFNRAQVRGLGIGLSVATGDQFDVDVWEVAEYALDDPQVRVVMLVVETVDASGLERAATAAHAVGKVIVLLPLGRTDVGRQAVLSHSGSLAGDAVVQSAVLRQLGVIEVGELDDLWSVAWLVDSWGPPRTKESSLGVIALSGGEGALIADAAGTHGLDLPPTSTRFDEFIARTLAFGSGGNPFDPSGEVIGRPEKVKLVFRAFLEQNDYSEVLIAAPVLRPEIAARQFADLAEIVAEPRPHVCLSYWPAGDLTAHEGQLLNATGLPVFETSAAAVRAIAHYQRAGRRGEPRVRPGDRPATGTLAPDERYAAVRDTFAAVGVPFADGAVARSPEEAVALAEAYRRPVVLKANVRSSTHKFANGLIALDLATPAEVEKAFVRLAAAGRSFDADGVMVESQATGRIEVMVGAHRDPEFGGVVIFGSGGTLVEYLEDSAVAATRYLGPDDSAGMIRATRIGRFLADRAPGSADRLAAIIGLVGEWFGENEQIASLDLNPLIVDLARDRLICVDARVE